jgi:hypothetical protein
VLAEALREQIRSMVERLAKVDARHGDRAAHRSLSLRLEANELRRDISKAAFLIDRLRRRFPTMELAAESEAAAGR